MNGNIYYSYNAGKIKAIGKSEKALVGGIISKSRNRNIQNVYNVGEIVIQLESDTTNNIEIGGVSGELYNTGLTNGYNIGTLNINNIENIKKIGSIVGVKRSSTLTNCKFLEGTYSKRNRRII